MQSAGLTETRFYPPIKKLAKATKLRYQAEHPHFVYSMLGHVNIPYKINNFIGIGYKICPSSI